VANVTLVRAYDVFLNSPKYTTTADVALLTLDKPIFSSTGQSPGSFGVGYLSDLTSYNGMPLNTAGYPGSPFSGSSQFNQYGPIIGAMPDTPALLGLFGDPGTLLEWKTESITSIGGQSGSPLWVYDPSTGQRTIYGVLVAGPIFGPLQFQGSTGIGDRITPSIFADLQTWRAQDAANPPSGPLTLREVNYNRTGGPAGPGMSVAGSTAMADAPAGFAGVGVGAVDTTTATWELRSTQDAGAPSFTPFQYGEAGWIPVTGDWTGTGQIGIGMFDPATATWYLRSSATPGTPDVGVFRYGAPGDIPVVGDWNGDGTFTIGVARPNTTTGVLTWLLRNSNSPGAPDITPFAYGAADWKPVAGDWNGDGVTTVGAFDPIGQFGKPPATWYLRNENSAGAPDIAPFAFGAAGWKPVVGRWNGSGGTVATIGAFDPVGEFSQPPATWNLRNQNSVGAPTTMPFAFGETGWTPVAGAWRGIADVPQLALPAGGEGPTDPFDDLPGSGLLA
jgi:hypothetical protein